MRPALRPGLLPLWRDRDTIQIGVDPRRAAALAGVGAAAAVIELLDGGRDRAQVIAAATELGVPVDLTERTLTLLAAAGMLIDFPAATVRALPPELRQLLLPELAAASLARMDSDGGGKVLARRAAATVQIAGDGPLPAAIAQLLTSSGVAARQAPLGPDRRPGERHTLPAPALVVLTALHPPEPVVQLLRDRIPHLAVSAGEAIGVVGPLVRPGATACMRCLDLARTDRDPAWPLILAQLSTRRPDPPACDAVLTTAVTAQAAAQVLHFVDRPELTGPAENATLELVQPGWQWRRRSWLPHPACICRAAAAA
jgi:bacteriocin biosynthesis cyclodehydratase domain-containing protein